MTITMEKGKLIGFFELSKAIKAKGRKSRALVKFGKILTAKIQDLQEEEKALIAEYFEVGTDGNAKQDDEGNPIALEGADTTVYSDEWVALHKEESVIDLTEYQPYMEHLMAALEDWDEPINGFDAVMYDELLDILESAE